ncbi:MAG: PrsW family intramembrane metalloprotease [bacterium]|nr:PrsW family intramembrane metalloprotease [bacterium]
MTSAPLPPAHRNATWTPVPDRHRSTLALEIVGGTLGLLGVIAGITVLLPMYGAGATAVATGLALIPLIALVLVVLWVDRWEPEPKGMLLLAFLWGAGVSGTLAMVLNTMMLNIFITQMSEGTAMTLLASVVAPITEETTKGIVLLLILWLRPRAIDGVVDGMVYSALSAAGFAFTENISYFLRFGDIMGEVFFVRAIQGPFAHVSFTIMMGITIGIAARHRSRWAWTWLFPLGLVLAMLLHGLWNYSNNSMATQPFVYWALQIPMLVILVGSMVYLRHQESIMIKRRASEFARAGWLTEHEAHMLGSFQERGRAIAWARKSGRADLMKDMQRTATRLAYNRERAASGRVQALDHADQSRLLQELTVQRGALYGTPAIV